MAIDLEQRIIKSYDEMLYGLPHISSLKINVQGFEHCLESIYANKKYNDEAISSAHNNIIGNIVFSNVFPDYIEAKTYIVYPHFRVNTYYPNPAYIHKEKDSMETSVIIGKRQELNMHIPNNKYNGPLSYRYMQVLNMERITIEPGIGIYKLHIRTIPSDMFYTFYNKLIAGKDPRLFSEHEFNWYKNKAIHEALIASNAPIGENTLEGEYTLYDEDDYAMLKMMLKNTYSISFSDTFTTQDGEDKSMWLSLGIAKFDNRVIANFNGKNDIIPLSMQKQLNRKIDQVR
ncbi:MAG: hypothetical protein J1F35_07850 [Erysipelotrichales bacterium]|nr:hypothetical protein [Erysipelotrichales bacterium]